MLYSIDFFYFLCYNIYMTNSIKTIKPSFDSKLTEVLFTLEQLKFRGLGGSTPPWIFYDLKEVIHLVESFSSAKIEGNKTTLFQAATSKVAQKSDNEALLEIENIRRAIVFIEEHLSKNGEINTTFIREIHKITTEGLTHNNGNTPGKFREIPVSISKTSVKTAEPFEVLPQIDDLVKFLNSDYGDRYTIIKIAITHHRFTVIHPFLDGNGRTARLLTYAMLLKEGFVGGGDFGVLNPMSIFGADRQLYFDKLSQADTQTDEGIEEWCLFVASGIKKEIEKILKLLNKEYTVNNFILPAIKECVESQFINTEEEEILKIAIKKDVFQRSDISHIFGASNSAKTRASRRIASMVEKGLIMPRPDNSKKYVVRFSNNVLLPPILNLMDESGMLPVSNSKTKD